MGRKDFYKISSELFKELKEFAIIKDLDVWNKVQIEFLEAHKYHTEYSKKNRQPHKEKRIAELKHLVKQ